MSSRTMEGFAKRSRGVTSRPVNPGSRPRRGAAPSGQTARQMTASEAGPPLETAQFLLKQGLNLPYMKSYMEAAQARGAYDRVGEGREDETDDGAGPTGQDRPDRNMFDSSLHETTSAENEDATPGSQARPIDLDGPEPESHWPPQPRRGHFQGSLEPGADLKQNQEDIPEHRGPYDEFEDDLDPFLDEDSQLDTQVIQNNPRIGNEVSQQMKMQQIKTEASQQNQIFGTDPGSLDTTVTNMEVDMEPETSHRMLSQTGDDETYNPAHESVAKSGQLGSAGEERILNERYRKLHQQQSLYEFQARQQSQKLIHEAAREKNELPTNGSKNQASPAGKSAMYLPLPGLKVPNKTNNNQASPIPGAREQTDTPFALPSQLGKTQEYQRNQREIVPYGYQSGESQMRVEVEQNVAPPNSRFDSNDHDLSAVLPLPTRGNRRQLTATTRFAMRDWLAPETNQLFQSQQQQHEIDPGSALLDGSLTERTPSRPVERDWRQEQRHNPTPPASGDDQVELMSSRSAQQKRHREQVDDMLPDMPYDRLNGQNRCRPAQSEVPEDDLDYTPAKLREMSFKDLQSEPFDKAAICGPSIPPFNMVSHSLAERLDAVTKLGSHERTQLFGSLAIEDWARAGDWLTHRMQEVTGQLNASRRERRAISRRYEDEVARRHEVAVEEHRELDEEWKHMQNKGQNVISTPRSVRKKS